MSLVDGGVSQATEGLFCQPEDSTTGGMSGGLTRMVRVTGFTGSVSAWYSVRRAVSTSTTAAAAGHDKAWVALVPLQVHLKVQLSWQLVPTQRWPQTFQIPSVLLQ